MAEHELKVWPEFFRDIWDRKKNFEVRKNDRGFKVGDSLILRQFDPDRNEYMGGTMCRFVDYVLDGGQFGIEPGYVVLGLH